MADGLMSATDSFSKLLTASPDQNLSEVQHMARPIYEIIYSKLEQVLGDLTQLPDHIKLEASGFMDLSMDVLVRESDHIRISLSHYYSQNGDLVPDPDMELRIFPDLKMAEALTFQDAYRY